MYYDAKEEIYKTHRYQRMWEDKQNVKTRCNEREKEEISKSDDIPYTFKEKLNGLRRANMPVIFTQQKHNF
jgi:hypothetical protein